MPFIPHTEEDVEAMLASIGAQTIDELFDEIPADLKTGKLAHIPPGMSEMEISRLMLERAQQDGFYLNFIGAGAYEHHIPAAVWQITTRGEFYSSYTPYQAEIAQGRLEALLNFQTVVIDLTGLPIANASLLDEATAAAEGMGMSYAIRGGEDRNVFLVDAACHPQTIEVVCTRAETRGIRVRIANLSEIEIGEDVFGILLQYPATDGRVADLRDVCERAHAVSALVTMATDLLALTMLRGEGKFIIKLQPMASADGDVDRGDAADASDPASLRRLLSEIERLSVIDPELMDNELIFPDSDTLAKAHVFRSLTPEEEEKYNGEFLSVIGA